jgi:predicted transcriptional regulator
VAEHAEEQKSKKPRSDAELTTEIVVAYISRNTIAPDDLGDLIGAVAKALDTLGRESTGSAAKHEPAVPVRRSVQNEHLICLVCGKQWRALRRHLDAAHQLTPEAYRDQFGLRPDYPMAAPGYSRQRSEMAKRVGLGQRAQPPPRRRRPRSGA